MGGSAPILLTDASVPLVDGSRAAGGAEAGAQGVAPLEAGVGGTSLGGSASGGALGAGGGGARPHGDGGGGIVVAADAGAGGTSGAGGSSGLGGLPTHGGASGTGGAAGASGIGGITGAGGSPSAGGLGIGGSSAGGGGQGNGGTGGTVDGGVLDSGTFDAATDSGTAHNQPTDAGDEAVDVSQQAGNVEGGSEASVRTTESLLLAKNGAACLKCAKDNCFDVNLAFTCENDPNPIQVEGCLDTLQCLLGSRGQPSCALANFSELDCYCGTPNDPVSFDCSVAITTTTNGTPGTCLALEKTGFTPNDHSTIFNNFCDTTQTAGAANNIVHCLVNNLCDEVCLNQH